MKKKVSKTEAKSVEQSVEQTESSAKKYLFPAAMLLLVIGIVFSITHFTQPPEPEAPELDGWTYVTRDKFGNFYYASLPSIEFEDGGEIDDIDFKFHATYRKTYSAEGREELANLFGDRDRIDRVEYEIETLHFREKLEGKYIEGAERKFYRKDGVEIPEFQTDVTVEADKPLPRSSVGENLYDFAYNRLKK